MVRFRGKYLGCSPDTISGFCAVTPGLLRTHGLDTFLGAPVVGPWSVRRASAVVVWGRKPSAAKGERLAAKRGLPVVRLEDGFLRSFGTGDVFPPLSIVVDSVGIYYDSTRPSALETLLESEKDVLEGLQESVGRARRMLLEHRLSKYNHAPDLDAGCLPVGARGRVLVVDQTVGDLSVRLGGGGTEEFSDMLRAAREENPQATVYVKTHPEVAAGRKGGYLTTVMDDDRTVVLRDPVTPLSLIEHMDRVYVVSSTMGFEALLAGKPVTCFGVPWYAGWGVTDDRQKCPRRSRHRTVDELFAAAYFHYARYLDPETHRLGSIFDVIGWLVRQREMAVRRPGRTIAVGFRRWRQKRLRPLLSLFPERVNFVPDADRAALLYPKSGDTLVCWGERASDKLKDVAERGGAALERMEDGFVRSVGLGSDFVPPLSLVMDRRGIYFDPSQASDLEEILNGRLFSSEDLVRARRVRELVVAEGITKYNVERRQKAPWLPTERVVLLVPGQVEDDASIRLGCVDVRTNLELLKAARASHPDAFIVYKPHPDVLSSNRRGRVVLEAARNYADWVETELSVVSCIEGCDMVHTMTSLAGFDALLRDRRVVVYGRPFYSGWGLTDDKVQVSRRTRLLCIDELVAGALLYYPIYWDWNLRGYSTCEATLRQIVESRDDLEASGRLNSLRSGRIRRQLRRAMVMLRALI
ncbi:MAG TPA: capsular polysaccharide biosynthesis protein [Nitrospira sp.]|nr:capsular polysaccharide biosynthesis protein [Rhodocyclaceae bacterium]HQV12097.1 capsular polysaccharide biosynthesis protein [Nitrospira sp.]